MKLAFDTSKLKTTVTDGVAHITYEDVDAYLNMAKENGIEKAAIEKMNTFDSAYIKQAATIVTEAAKDAFKNEEVNLVTSDIGFNIGGTVHTTINRSVTVPDDNGKAINRPTVDVMVESPRFKVSSDAIIAMENSLNSVIAAEED